MDAETPERVEEIAVEILAAGAGSNGNGSHKTPEPSPLSRRALPTGNVVSESVAGSNRMANNPNRGARLAGKAMSAMKTKKST